MSDDRIAVLASARTCCVLPGKLSTLGVGELTLPNTTTTFLPSLSYIKPQNLIIPKLMKRNQDSDTSLLCPGLCRVWGAEPRSELWQGRSFQTRRLTHSDSRHMCFGLWCAGHLWHSVTDWLFAHWLFIAVSIPLRSSWVNRWEKLNNEWLNELSVKWHNGILNCWWVLLIS